MPGGARGDEPAFCTYRQIVWTAWSNRRVVALHRARCAGSRCACSWGRRPGCTPSRPRASARVSLPFFVFFRAQRMGTRRPPRCRTSMSAPGCRRVRGECPRFVGVSPSVWVGHHGACGVGTVYSATTTMHSNVHESLFMNMTQLHSDSTSGMEQISAHVC